MNELIKKKIALTLKITNSLPEVKKRRSDGIKKKWKDPLYRKKQHACMTSRVPSLESNIKRSITLFNRKFSLETRKKMSISAKKRWIDPKYESYRKSHINRMTGKNNPNWIKNRNKISYQSKHDFIRNKYGRPMFCENCGSENSKAFDWANISKQYKLNIDDWLRLCRRCHILYDRDNYDIKPNFPLVHIRRVIQ